MPRRAKIVATIGPSSDNLSAITQLISAGVDVARLNFSHGTQETHALIFERIREFSRQTNRPVTILQDLQGPKIRIGDIETGKADIIAGQKLILTTRQIIGNNEIIPVDFPEILDCAIPGARILLDDGNLEVQIQSIKDTEITTTVILGGVIKSNKGINLPGSKLSIPGFTEKDRADLAFGLQLGVDAVAVSFVRTPSDVLRVRRAIQEIMPGKRHPPVIAKLERPEALDNLDGIIQVSDGVMVARGDLGVEMPPETVPIAQKHIIASANRHSKLVITATQMLDSMILNPRPTRAEASDVANAIFDGTDAVMLSGETASGRYPVQAVQMMDAIICQAEENMPGYGHWKGNPLPETDIDDTHFIAQACKELAHDRNVAAIAVFTQSGRSARYVAKTRPGVPILAFTPDPATFYQLSLYWGVLPRLVAHVASIEEMVTAVEGTIIETTSLKPGQQVVVICGFPIHAVRPTNLVYLHTIGSI